MSKLIDTTSGHEINKGDRVMTFRGEHATLVGWTPPHKPGSTGRVTLDFGNNRQQSFFPNVINSHIVTD